MPQPSLDPSQLLGGRLGERAAGGGVWLNPNTWVFFLGTLSWLILMLRQLPCSMGADVYASMCYSDIRPLFYWRGLADGLVPFVGADVEYPVLIGALMEIARQAVVLLGGELGPEVSDAAKSHAADLFGGVTALMMFAFFLVLLWAHLRLRRPWDALMIAISPTVMAAGLINWDLMVLAFTSLAIYSWSRQRTVWAGIWIGLGIAAKLYPILLLVPLAVLCFRTGKFRPFVVTALATAGSWLAVNLPVYLVSPSGWTYFWTFNVDRGAELGSLWYVLSLAGIPVDNLSRLVSVGMVLGTTVICLLMLLAPRRPRLSQGVFLMVVLFLVLNKVYSPQYMLWLLPLLVLARPRWLDWTIFTVAEVLYFGAIWAHLGGTLSSGSGSERLYSLSVLLRIAVELWLACRVVVDMYRPGRDPLRQDGWDDPHGGVLDGAPDAAWFTAWSDRLLPWRR